MADTGQEVLCEVRQRVMCPGAMQRGKADITEHSGL